MIDLSSCFSEKLTLLVRVILDLINMPANRAFLYFIVSLQESHRSFVL